MCKLIADLVGSDEHIVSEMINRLERLTAESGIDLRISSDIYSHVRGALRALGLDPRDTTAEELYHSLLNLADRHDGYMREHYGISQKASCQVIFDQTTHIMNRLNIDRQAWVIKPSTARRLLKLNPPKHLMKLLHYRSLNSLLKREPTAALMATAMRLESVTWQKQLFKLYRGLTPLDFEIRSIEFLSLPTKRWSRVADMIASKNHTHVIASVELGGVLVLPLKTLKTKGLTLLTSLLSLRQLNDIRVQSTYLKLHQAQSNFSQLLIETIYGNKQDHISILGQPAHWQVMHLHYGSSQRPPELFSPHIQAEDLSYQKAEIILGRLEPALHFWHGLDFVGLVQTSGPISFNLIDAVLNLVNNVPYERRLSLHMKNSLWNELYKRYLAHPSVESHVLGQLDERLVGHDAYEDSLFAELELLV